MRVTGGLVVKALDCRSKGPRFQSQVPVPLATEVFWVHSSLPQKLSRRFTFTSFRGDIQLLVPAGEPLKIIQVLLGISLLTGSSQVINHTKLHPKWKEKKTYSNA